MNQPFYGNAAGIRGHVDKTIDAIRDAIGQGNVSIEADQVRFLIALSAPKIDATEARKLVEKIENSRQLDPRDDRDGEGDRQVHKACMEVLESVLGLLSREKIYATPSMPEEGGSDLALTDDALTGNDPI